MVVNVETALSDAIVHIAGLDEIHLRMVANVETLIVLKVFTSNHYNQNSFLSPCSFSNQHSS